MRSESFCPALEMGCISRDSTKSVDRLSSSEGLFRLGLIVQARSSSGARLIGIRSFSNNKQANVSSIQGQGGTRNHPLFRTPPVLPWPPLLFAAVTCNRWSVRLHMDPGTMESSVPWNEIDAGVLLLLLESNCVGTPRGRTRVHGTDGCQSDSVRLHVTYVWEDGNSWTGCQTACLRYDTQRSPVATVFATPYALLSLAYVRPLVVIKDGGNSDNGICLVLGLFHVSNIIFTQA